MSSSCRSESTSGMQSTVREPQNMKEYYEMQMRNIKNSKKRKSKLIQNTCNQNQASFASQRHKYQSVSSTPKLGKGTSDDKKSQKSSQVSQRLENQHLEQTCQTQTTTDSATEGDMYKRGMLWKKKIDDINHSKAQIAKHFQALGEIRECTFKPQLVTSKYNQELEMINVKSPTKNSKT